MITADDAIFVSRCRTAIEMMREEGMNETRIAVVLTTIRSAALSQEFFRLQELVRTNPPTHLSHGAMMDIARKYEG
jgi:hypothetical protein